MNSPDLPAWMWRDPAEVAERVEAGTCKGCFLVYVIEEHALEICAKGRPFGKRCKQYMEDGDGD